MPARHSVFATQAVAGFASPSHVSPPQSTVPAVPPAQNVPAAQAAHTVGVVEVEAPVCTVPAAHEPAGRQADRSGAFVYVPGAQP